MQSKVINIGKLQSLFELHLLYHACKRIKKACLGNLIPLV